MDWSVLTDSDANLGDDARAALAGLSPDTRTGLSQALGTIGQPPCFMASTESSASNSSVVWIERNPVRRCLEQLHRLFEAYLARENPDQWDDDD